jgi:16S rRNA (guanine527-N7)-methyltransferase
VTDAQQPVGSAASEPLPTIDPKLHLTQLQAGCRTLGIDLDLHQLAQFERYAHDLAAWNAKFNLTAITDYADVQVKHFLDCLAALPLLAEELGEPLPLQTARHLLDVGSGAGFPGLPLKIAAPRLQVTLMDGTGKKILFLQEMVSRLALAHVKLAQGRAEEMGRNPDYRGQFDLVTARAVAPLNVLVEYLLPLVRRGGLAVIYKGASAPQEFIEARKAIDLLGGETVRLAPVQVPLLGEQRFILLIKKSKPTPERFPRGQGLARKKPLG